MEVAAVRVALVVGEPAPVHLGKKLGLGSAAHAGCTSWLQVANISAVIDCRGKDASLALQVGGWESIACINSHGLTILMMRCSILRAKP